MNDLEKFIDFLYEGQQGFVYSPVKYPDDWESKFFAWPLQKEKLLDHIKVNSEDGDVYLAPAVFKKKDATREGFKSSSVVWVEFDGKEQIDFQEIPRPNVIIQTSSETHLHCYWKTGITKNYKALEDVNRRLTYYLQADSSGTESNQLLRPPLSKNNKRGGLPVNLIHFEETLPRVFSDFDSAPEVEREVIEVKEAQLLDFDKLIKQVQLPKKLRHKIEKEEPVFPYRSQFLFKVAHELAEYGCNHTQITSFISHINDRIGKFGADRLDRLVRLSEIASIAIHAQTLDEELSVYSLEEVLKHTEDLEWIYERWLHNQGILIVTGAPGVGKTQFCLQLANAFSVGGKFLTSDLIQKQVLLLSLEMNIRELKFFVRKQAPSYQNLNQSFKNFSIVDEPGTLIQYEDLIADKEPGVLIIDSLFELANGKLVDGEEVITLTRWLKRLRRKYNCAIILIHHNRKGGVGNKKPNKLEDMFGSQILNKEIDTAFCLWQEEDQDEIEFITVKHRYTQREEFLIKKDEHLIFSKVEDGDDSNDSGRVSETKANLNF